MTAFFISQGITLFGSSLVQFAIIWYIAKTTSSGVMVTLSTFCSFLPQVCISLFAGVWVDRYDRKKLIILADAFIAISTLGGLYGMRRSEILGLRWRNVDLENNTFDVMEQLPFRVPPKTMVIEEMAPPKSNGRRLPITEVARPFFEKQLAFQAACKESAEKQGQPYYDNDLVVSKSNGAPQAANWISSGFGKLLKELEMPHIRFHDLRHTAATNMHQLTGDFYTVGEMLGHTLAGIGASLGLSMNFEAVTARYVDVRLERKQEVLDRYHDAVHPKAKQPDKKKPEQEKTPERSV
ncbi:tyrosine-type recombinase/integrase [Clostridium sp. DJ247]|uniref:tyrosine-type recombinase/integrase n=1 Tax=Clostridium sp. DJ247 TaxID=2726188 RepID=UPI0016247276|nr:tyrosine-type recombinase/integrase [Clostridium sp. DJ247]MBC2581310.1 tyrosine-type recombinase/integrase [Clostridium sp. DJ247]